MVTALGKLPSEIDDMAYCDVVELFESWATYPPEHVILAAVHGLGKGRTERKGGWRSSRPSDLMTTIAEMPPLMKQLLSGRSPDHV